MDPELERNEAMDEQPVIEPETSEETPAPEVDDKPKKKRGRPTKAESEAKRLKEEAEAALRGPAPEPEYTGSGNVRFVSQRYLLRPGNDETQTVWITISIPVDTTMEEAERLATFVSSCYYAD